MIEDMEKQLIKERRKSEDGKTKSGDGKSKTKVRR